MVFSMSMANHTCFLDELAMVFSCEYATFCVAWCAAKVAISFHMVFVTSNASPTQVTVIPTFAGSFLSDAGLVISIRVISDYFCRRHIPERCLLSHFDFLISDYFCHCQLPERCLLGHFDPFDFIEA